MALGTLASGRNLLKVAALALGSALSLGAATEPAQAQFFGFWGARSFSYSSPGIEAGEVAGIVADEGMRLVRPPFRNGNVFVADAVDRRGWQHRLIIDAYSGDIVQSFGRNQAQPGRLTPDREDGVPLAPPARVARANPGEPTVIPGIGTPERSGVKPAVKSKPKVEKKKPAVARAPIETRPLAVPLVKEAVPQPVLPVAPARPSDPPATSVEAPAREPEKPAEQPVAKAPVDTGAPSVNDVPVAPLYEPPVKPATGKVNDVPVAPLD